MKKCTTYCIAKNFSMQKLKESLENRHKTSVIRDVIQIEEKNTLTFIFHYGVVVFWNTSYDNEKRLLEELSEVAEEVLDDYEIDDFTFEENAKQSRIHEDHIYLTDETSLEKLAISHAIAQSVKMGVFEKSIQKTIEDTRSIPMNLAKTGRTQLKGKKLAKTRGELFLAKSNINLHYDLLDTPEFFWEYPELESFYMHMAMYLDIKNRLDTLNKKLETIHEMLEMLADEQKHQHSSMLEIIIIWLIVFEVFISIFHDILGLF